MNFMDIRMHGRAITIIFIIWGFHSVVDKKRSVLEYDAVLTDDLLTNFQRFWRFADRASQYIYLSI